MQVNPSELVARAKATIHEYSIADARGCIDRDTILIDIREPDEIRRGYIPGAVFLPRGLLEFEIHGLVEQARRDPALPAEDQPIVLYCGTGGRSTLAAVTLEDMGYRNVKSLAGGIVAWAQARLPVDVPF